MKQILMTNDRTILARMPRVSVEPGSLLVQTHFSLISTGTEIASLKAVLAQQDSGALGKAAELSSRAAFYLGKAINNPTKAAQRLKQIAANRVRQLTESVRRPRNVAAASEIADIGWRSADATQFESDGMRLRFTSDDSPAGYQVLGRRISLSELRAPTSEASAEESSSNGNGAALIISIKGHVSTPYTLGMLNGDQSAWVAQITLATGPVAEVLQFDTSSADAVHLVFANCGEGSGTAEFSEMHIRLAEPQDGLPASETGHIGWNVGYSAAGEVIAVGAGVTGYQIGDLVACAGAGQANHAEFISVKQNLCVHVPAGTPLHLAATTTVGSIAMQGLRRTDPRLGEVVCVVGLGLIGLICVQLFRAAGCRVIGLDLDPSRVARALQLGASAAVTDSDECLRLCLHQTNGHGADATIITAATKSDAPINQAMRTTRRRGRVVIVGDIGMNIERPEFYKKEIDVLMSTSYGPGRYDATYEIDGRDYPYAYVRWTQNRNMAAYLDLVANGAVDVSALIDEIVPIDAAPAAYESLARSTSPPLGVVIEYPQAKVELDAATIDQRDSARISIRGARKPLDQLVGYCLVGAGGFGTSMLVPQMDKRRDVFQLKGVVSRDPVRGGNFARQRGVEVLATDLDSVLRDDSIQLVVIATRHHEHAEQVAKCLAAGKHVFVEKPLALSWEELDLVRAAHEAAPDRLLMVGFNRGFAPAALAVKDALKERRAPMIINYQLNGGYIPADSWIQNAQGGGRNLGEACHMYDFFASLTNSPIASISARGISTNSSAYFANDNFVATLGYEDGSICNLVYTAAGPKQGLAKERIEIFCEGRAFLIDDFVQCVEYPGESTLWHGPTDKGHFNELSALADSLHSGTDAPIPIDRIFETTAAALHIEDLLQGRDS